MKWRRRTWEPNQQILLGDGRTGTRISAKRICDGPHAEPVRLGDPTEVEMVAAVRGRPLNSVQSDCGLCRGFHVLFAEPDVRPHDWRPRDGDTWTVHVLCPGVPDGAKALPCATWEPCGCSQPGDDPLTVEFQSFLTQPCPKSPTGEHRWMAGLGFVGAPTGGCWYQRVGGAADAAAEVVTAPGMWPVEVDAFDETTPVFIPVDLGLRVVPDPV